MLIKETCAGVAATAAFVMFLTGCDPASGVLRTARLNGLPPTASVRAALDAVPEVQEVRYRKIEPTAAWSLYEGMIHDPPYDQFSYRGSGASGTLEVQETENGEKELRLYYVEIGVRLSRDFVDRTRALMDKVYASLLAHIPELPPASQVHEELIRVRD
jgi:hypothetical protein